MLAYMQIEMLILLVMARLRRMEFQVKTNIIKGFVCPFMVV